MVDELDFQRGVAVSARVDLAFPEGLVELLATARDGAASDRKAQAAAEASSAELANLATCGKTP